MVFVVAGENASEATARLAICSCASGVQLAPASVDFHTPPATPPAYMTFGLPGSMMSARVRPPWFEGPRFDHVVSAAPGSAAVGSGISS